MNVWIKRKNAPDAVVSVIADIQCGDAELVYNLYTAFEEVYVGRILFDDQHDWIYDGDELTTAEQEQVGKFIRQNIALSWSS